MKRINKFETPKIPCPVSCIAVGVYRLHETYSVMSFNIHKQKSEPIPFYSSYKNSKFFNKRFAFVLKCKIAVNYLRILFFAHQQFKNVNFCPDFNTKYMC